MPPSAILNHISDSFPAGKSNYLWKLNTELPNDSMIYANSSHSTCMNRSQTLHSLKSNVFNSKYNVEKDTMTNARDDIEANSTHHEMLNNHQYRPHSYNYSSSSYTCRVFIVEYEVFVLFTTIEMTPTGTTQQ